MSDPVTLEGADDDQFMVEMDARGFPFVAEEDLERLMELVAEQRTDEALDLVRQMAPATLHPTTIKRLVADRAAEGLKGLLS